MKYIILLISTFLFTSACATNYIAKTSDMIKTKQGKGISSGEIQIKAPQVKLPLGERLTYRVRWFGIDAGIITATIGPELKNINKRPAYKVEIIAKTNSLVSAIYKIDDKYISYIDIDTLCTLRHEVYRREGRFKKDAITDFDQATHTAYFENLLDKSKKTFTISTKSQDILSACYYFRMLKVKLNDKIEYFVVNNEQNYELFGIMEDKKFVRIKEIGNFESFFIQPYAKILGGEQVKKGRVSGYFSCDEKRLPILAVVEAPLFTKVTATLSKIEYIK